jgi:hypothetical protein
MDGNDANSGQQNSAGGGWRTIQRAANLMVAGDVVIVADGTYSEVVSPRSNGTQSARITYQAEGTNVVVNGFEVSKAFITIQGFVLVGEVTDYQGAITLNTGGDYAHVISNKFRISRANVYQVLVYHNAINVRGALLAGNQFLDSFAPAISLSSGMGHTVSNNTFTSKYGGDAVRVFASDVMITCNMFTNWSNVPMTSGPLAPSISYYFTSVGSDTNMDWSNVGAKRYYLIGTGATFVASGTTPQWWGLATLREIGTTNTLTNGQALVVGRAYYFLSNSGNPDFNNVGALPLSQYHVGAAYVFKATQDVPRVWGIGTAAMNANHTDIIQSFQNGSVGASPPDKLVKDVVFERNCVVACTNCQFGNITDDNAYANIDRWTFRNNVFAYVSARMNLYAPGFRFMNNTFYRCGGASGDVLNWRADRVRGISSNLWFYNNIMFECGYPDRANAGWYGGTLTNDQFCDYNLVIGRGAGRNKDTAMWTAYGRETHGLNGVDPLFVNPDVFDFRLQTNSPAIGAGTNLNVYFASDYHGKLRGERWDMGACLPESAAKPPSTTRQEPSAPKRLRQAP